MRTQYFVSSSAKSLVLLLFSCFIISTYCDFKFNEKGEFTVLQFTDFHYCEEEEKDDHTEELQRRLLDLVKPDLVVVSGDAVGGYAGYTFYLFKDNGFFEECWKRFTQPFVDAKVPYAYTLGNHDAEGDFNRKQIVQLDKTNPYSVLRTAEGVPDSATFRVPIYSSKNESHLATNIWIFDSGSLGCKDHDDSWGCIEEQYLDWYDQESKKLKEQYGTNVHHIAFYHIAIPEYINVIHEEKIYGTNGETICCPQLNTGLFGRIMKNQDISGMFIGHDHNNDFGGWYQGVEFVYGRKSGFGSYGTTRGARVLNFKETINEAGETVVTREHYVIHETGEYIRSKELYKTNGPASTQQICPPAGENSFILLRRTGFFEYVKMFLIALAGFLVLWKVVPRLTRVVKKHTKPKEKYVELSIDTSKKEESPEDEKDKKDESKVVNDP